jgi:phage replication-related protein YjqB (UPF0714/DUF867 family)
MTHQDRYTSFAELARCEARGIDYGITVVRRPASEIAVIAPHGGGIEKRTAEIARAIAGDEFNLYLFEGIKASGNFAALHITSRRFDEPSCLSLLRECSSVVAIHGCIRADERVLIGGLDTGLKNRVAEALRQAGLRVDMDGHRFRAEDPSNICNRGRSNKGVQLELSRPLRGSANEPRVVQAIRTVLLSVHAAG